MNTLEGEVSMVGMIKNAFSFDVTLAVAVLCIMIVAGAATKTATEAAAKSHWIHRREVPRFGGVAIILGPISRFLADDPTSNSVSYAMLLSSSVPLVLTGISEDIGKEIKPSVRILAGFASGFVAVFLTGSWITGIEVPYFDLLLSNSNNCHPALRLCINNHCAQLQSH